METEIVALIPVKKNSVRVIAMLSLDALKIAYYVTDNYYYNDSYTSVRLK